MKSRLILSLICVFVFVTEVYGQQEVPAGITVHVVQRGENLFRIALQYGLTADVVAQANGINDPGRIMVGQRLIIPTEGQNEILTASSDVPSSIHVVQPGETLFRIATQYGLSVAELQQANEIADPTVIYAGQQLVIPGVEAPEMLIVTPDGVTDFDLYPALLTEGRSGRIRLVTAQSARVTGMFLGRSLSGMGEQGNTVHYLFMAVPVFTEPGLYPLSLNIVLEDGRNIDMNLDVQVVGGGYVNQYITLPEDRLDLLAPAVDENELNLLSVVTSGFTAERYFDGPISLPAAAAMNSPFGARRSYNGGPFDRYHSGADFAGAPGSPVLAAASGRVVLADTLNVRGVSVVIDHGWGVYTTYAHLSDRYVQLGDFVTTGQTIGTVGSSGRATGAHLHWELWLNGVAVDPMQWVLENFL